MKHSFWSKSARAVLIVMALSLMLSACATSPPLLKAAHDGDSARVKTLIEQGADLSAGDSKGHTPLLAAAKMGHTSIVTTLLDHGADIHSQDNFGQNALMEATWGGHAETVGVLLERGARVDEFKRFGETAILWAAYKGRSDITKFLLKHGADVNVKNISGTTPLIGTVVKKAEDPRVAMLKSFPSGGTGTEKLRKPIETAEILIAAGADIHWRDNKGRNALYFAMERGHTKIAALLRKEGKSQVQGESGRSLLGISFVIKTPFGQTLYPEYVTFARIGENEGAATARVVLKTGYHKGGLVPGGTKNKYLYDAPPGRYAPVVAQIGKDQDSSAKYLAGNPEPAPNLQVIYLPRQMVENSIVEVKPGKIVFAGEYVIAMDSDLKKADDVQNHYIFLTLGKVDRSTLNRLASSLPAAFLNRGKPTGTSYFVGKVMSSAFGPDAERKFLETAKEEVEDTTWRPVIDRQLQNLK